MSCIRDRPPSRIDGVYTGFHSSHLAWLTRHQYAYRLLDMWIWWCLTRYAVGGRTADVMVWLMWHEHSDSLSWHNKTGSTFFGVLHQLGYRWHYCASSLSLMVLHTSYLTSCCTSASTCQKTKWQLAWLWHVSYFMFVVTKSIFLQSPRRGWSEVVIQLLSLNLLLMATVSSMCQGSAAETVVSVYFIVKHTRANYSHRHVFNTWSYCGLASREPTYALSMFTLCTIHLYQPRTRAQSPIS